MTLRFGIHGSCVTRDIFAHVGEDEKLEFYQARTSLCTKGPTRGMLNLEWIQNLSDVWEQRMVAQDLERTPLDLYSIDVLIFDLIDERFNIHHVDGELMTASKQFLDSGGQGMLNSEMAFPIGSEERYESFRKGCAFMQDLLQDTDVKVFFHDARWAASYVSGDGIHDFEKQGAIAGSNKRLTRMSEMFIQVIKPERILCAPEDLILGDAGHRWGKASFHYVSEYYDCIWSQIMEPSD